ncbi:unnamed protein product [Soboliphyme baturini]|uniref:Transposase n=1 Tax=Soboliphyme baturini TaxID=241478 RepID=A0A183IJB5_9BILA|nr:unnamed protein product [Soboliphyme baturini]
MHWDYIKDTQGKYDGSIKELVRQCLHVPARTSIHWLLEDAKRGGVDIPMTRTDHAVLRVSLTLQLLWSSSPKVASVASQELRGHVS